MKNLINTIVLIIVTSFSFAQTTGYKTIEGKVENDSIKVENVIVFNSNSRTGVVVDNDGNFSIKATKKDTLIFSSLNFRTQKIAVTDEVLSETLLLVKLKIFARQLKEITVSKKNVIKAPVKENTQAIVDKPYFDDNQSSPKNRNVYDGTIENGTDFVRLFKDIMKLLRKKNNKQTDFFSNVDFTEAVLQKVKYSFYTKTLQLKDEEIRLFLVFCENDPKAKTLLKSKYEFELMDYMVAKNKEFQELVKAKK